MKVIDVDPLKVKFGELSPRAHYDRFEIEEMMEEWRKNQGFLHRPIVRLVKGKPELIVGGRRLVASQELKRLGELETIPVDVMDASDTEVLELSIRENIKRRDIAFFEEGRGYHMMILQMIKRDGLAPEVYQDKRARFRYISEVAQRIGVSMDRVRHALFVWHTLSSAVKEWLPKLRDALNRGRINITNIKYVVGRIRDEQLIRKTLDAFIELQPASKVADVVTKRLKENPHLDPLEVTKEEIKRYRGLYLHLIRLPRELELKISKLARDSGKGIPDYIVDFLTEALLK